MQFTYTTQVCWYDIYDILNHSERMYYSIFCVTTVLLTFSALAGVVSIMFYMRNGSQKLHKAEGHVNNKVRSFIVEAPSVFWVLKVPR